MKLTLRTARARTGEGKEHDERKSTTSLCTPAYLTHSFPRIWEKKYGKNAMHLKTRVDGSRAPHQSKRDFVSRGNVSQDAHGRQQGRNASVQRVNQHRPARGVHGHRDVSIPSTLAKKPTEDERPLHPSWEAKRKLKEKEKGGILPFQGTRITFDV